MSEIAKTSKLSETLKQRAIIIAFIVGVIPLYALMFWSWWAIVQGLSHVSIIQTIAQTGPMLIGR